MAERASKRRLYALVAEFHDPDILLAAVKAARAKGFTRIESFTPFPIEGLAEAAGFEERRIGPIMLVAGVVGAAAGYGMQVMGNLNYPLNVGGRPSIAPPAFALITFELTVLFAVIAGVVAMFLLDRLPRLNHPLFELETFHLASSDVFFLAILADDPRFQRARARAFLEGLKPVRVDEACFEAVAP